MSNKSNQGCEILIILVGGILLLFIKYWWIVLIIGVVAVILYLILEIKDTKKNTQNDINEHLTGEKSPEPEYQEQSEAKRKISSENSTTIKWKNINDDFVRQANEFETANDAVGEFNCCKQALQINYCCEPGIFCPASYHTAQQVYSFWQAAMRLRSLRARRPLF